MISKRPLILHPFLFALFPVVFLFSRNLGEFGLGDLVATAAKVLAASVLLWAGLKYLTGNGIKAGITVSLAALLFSSYGHTADVLRAALGSSDSAESHEVLMLAPAYAAVLAIAMAFTWRTKRPLIELTKGLNVVAVVLVAISAVEVAWFETMAWRKRAAFEKEAGVDVHARMPALPRNIYYIILDSYGREDKLEELYDCDSSDLVDFLRAKGFYVADRSRPNYSHTSLSISSSMNFEYLGDLSGKAAETDKAPLRDMTGNSRLARILKTLGYRTVSFNDPSEIYDADIYMTPPQGGEFERGLLNMTAAASARRERARDRARVAFAFDHMADTTRLEGPLFVYAHIMSPHPPFVFKSDGSDPGYERYFGTGSANHLIKRGGITRGEYIAEYRNQVLYLNTLVKKAVADILAKSSVPPIIIVQGDHGPGAFLNHEDLGETYLGDRMSMLSAYYLPDGGEARLYDSISPVNTFRVVLGRYFDADLPLLPDRSYFAPLNRPWQMTDVTSAIDSGEDRKRLQMLRGMEYWPGPQSRAQRQSPAGASQQL